MNSTNTLSHTPKDQTKLITKFLSYKAEYPFQFYPFFQLKKSAFLLLPKSNYFREIKQQKQ